MLTTRQTLLHRLQRTPTDAAWEDFYRTYLLVILSFARKQGLDAHGAEDVLQETMVALMRLLPTFNYDPKRRFRNLVLTIAYRKAVKALQRRRRLAEVPFEGAKDDDRPAPAETLPDETVPAPSDAVEADWRASLLEEALRRLAADPSIKGQTLDIFRAYVMEGAAAEVVGKRFGVSVNNIYQIRNRTLKALREIVRELDNNLEGSA